jgi:hypothetical protein
MRWSKLKKLIENNFAESIKSKVAIHSTAYGACTCGHAWLTLDGEVIANFCTRAFHNRFLYGDKNNDEGLSDEKIKRYENQYVEYGEISRQDVYESFWAYVHELSFDDALDSEDPLIQTLAVIDHRLGKRRYDKVKKKDLHPLARKLFDTRVSFEHALIQKVH